MRIIRAAAAAFLAALTGCYGPQPVSDYRATIKVFTHARLLLWTYELTPVRITVIRHPAGNGAGETVVLRELTDSERDRLGRFFARFSIDSLKERYASGIVTGNMHYTFDISVGGREKSVYVYYMRQNDLADLTAEIDRLLSRYRVHYR